MIGQVTAEEFAWQDAHYDRDSGLGRELLFLIANDDWVRSTSEIVDIVRSDAIETRIDIDVDLGRISHEAFRDRAGQTWLPVAVLPPLQQALPGPESFSTLTVTDAGGSAIMTLPQADVRHRLAAALTEIIASVAAARLPDSSATTVIPGRDERLVLSAGIYRLLRDETVPASALQSDNPAREMLPGPSGRIGRARNESRVLLSHYGQLLTDPAAAGCTGGSGARQLAERAVRLLEAFRLSAVIVVPVESGQQRTAVIRVTIPDRALHLATTTWAGLFGPAVTPHRQWRRSAVLRRRLRLRNWILPGASLHLDLLLPSADADRQLRVNLPAGISPDPSRPLDRRAALDVRCAQPQPVAQLAAAVGQLSDADAALPVPLHQGLADLALARASAVEATLRDHRAGAGPGDAQLRPDRALELTRAFRDRLRSLVLALSETTASGLTPSTRGTLEKAWAGGTWLAMPMQRRASVDTIGPGVVAGQVRAIDDPGQRSAVTSATMEVQIAVTDSAYYSAARLSGWINFTLMTIAAAFFGFCYLSPALRSVESRVSPEVIALVLTLFSAVQLGRIERSDRSTMRGVLVPGGNPLIVAAIIPAVVLAVAVAFSRSLTWVESWSAGCIAVQLSGQRLTWIRERRLLENGSPSRLTATRPQRAERDPEPGLLFYTDLPDYSHYAVLHSPWWRRATGEALGIGSAASGWIIWQRNAQVALDSLLANARPGQDQTALARLRGLHHPARTEPRPGDLPAQAYRSPIEQEANVLALQRSGTSAQSLTFAVFRDKPDADTEWSAARAVPVRLNPVLLTADTEVAIWVYLGQPPRQHSVISDHPVTAVLDLALRHGLTTIETQLPIPPPDASYTDLQWSRIELGAEPHDLSHLHLFLAGLLTLTGTATVAVQTRSDGIPRIINPRPQPQLAEPAHAPDRSAVVLSSDLDIVTRSGITEANPDDRNWRVTAICAAWHPGAERRLLAGLDPGLTLIGLTTAILHGQSVILLLGHNPAGLGPDAPGLHASVCLDERQGQPEPGPTPARPMLHAHLRTPDRPGATRDVLDALREAIQERYPRTLAENDMTVWYARAEVKDGSTPRIQLTIALPAPAPADRSPAHDWTSNDLREIEQRTLSLLVTRLSGTAHPADTAGALAGTTIQLGLVTAPDLASYHVSAPAVTWPSTRPEEPGEQAAQADPQRSSRRRARRPTLILTTLALTFLALTFAITGILISGSPVLSFGPGIVAGSVSAAGLLLSGLGAVGFRLSKRVKEHSSTSAPSSAAHSELQLKNLNPAEFDQLQKYRLLEYRQSQMRTESHRRRWLAKTAPAHIDNNEKLILERLTSDEREILRRLRSKLSQLLGRHK
jgi:hypothetical protein